MDDIKLRYRWSKKLKYRIDKKTGCWMWKACRQKKTGYGMSCQPTEPYAHRLAYTIHRGPIPEGLTLDHLCRNRGCVNPEHLEPMTLAQNRRKAPSCKLTREDAEAIKQKIADSQLSLAAIGREYGVSTTAVCAIKAGRLWAAK